MAGWAGSFGSCGEHGWNKSPSRFDDEREDFEIQYGARSGRSGLRTRIGMLPILAFLFFPKSTCLTSQ